MKKKYKKSVSILTIAKDEFRSASIIEVGHGPENPLESIHKRGYCSRIIFLIWRKFPAFIW